MIPPKSTFADRVSVRSLERTAVLPGAGATVVTSPLAKLEAGNARAAHTGPHVASSQVSRRVTVL
jgi:hypothetical protein